MSYFPEHEIRELEQENVKLHEEIQSFETHLKICNGKQEVLTEKLNNLRAINAELLQLLRRISEGLEQFPRIAATEALNKYESKKKV